MSLDHNRIGCGDLDYAISAFDAGLICKKQLAMDARIYMARRARPKYDAIFRAIGR